MTSTLPAVATPRIPPMSLEAIGKVRQLTEIVLTLPQVPFVTQHILHGGMYTRTVTLPAGTVATGALVKIPTVLTMSGEAIVYLGEARLIVAGHRVLPASAGRQQAFVTKSEFTITMSFKTDAKTVEEAEAQFTDDAHLLWPLADADRHEIIVTGE